MDVPALIQQAQAVLNVNQAGLAKRLRRGQSTVSRWESGDAVPDYESCLRLAMITAIPAVDVLRAAGHDPNLLPTAEQANLSPVQRDLLARFAGMLAIVDAVEGIPEVYVPTIVAKHLSRAEEDVQDQVKMVRGYRAERAKARRQGPNNGVPRSSNNGAPEASIQADSDDGPAIPTCQHPVNAHLTRPVSRHVLVS